MIYPSHDEQQNANQQMLYVLPITHILGKLRGSRRVPRLLSDGPRMRGEYADSEVSWHPLPRVHVTVLVADASVNLCLRQPGPGAADCTVMVRNRIPACE